MLFADELRESRAKINVVRNLNACLGKQSKIEYIKGKFRKKRTNNSLELKIREHAIITLPKSHIIS